jgi:hypothetical protein
MKPNTLHLSQPTFLKKAFSAKKKYPEICGDHFGRFFWLAQKKIFHVSNKWAN